MPLVSILTAAYAPNAIHLEETISAVSNLTLPDDWTMEWIVQEDGAAPALGERFAALPFVRYQANGMQAGPAVTRNMGLSRVRGSLVQVLDHDDLMLPPALATLIPLFEDESIHWAVGQADDLLPDGRRMPYESALPYGRLKRGQVNDWAIAHDANWPIHCAGLMMRTATLRAIGGYASSAVDDDIVMFAGLSEIADGFNNPAVTWLYRIHDLQLHKADMTKPYARQGRRMAVERIYALRQAPLRLDLTFRQPVPNEINVGPLIPEKLRHEN